MRNKCIFTEEDLKLLNKLTLQHKRCHECESGCITSICNLRNKNMRKELDEMEKNNLLPIVNDVFKLYDIQRKITDLENEAVDITNSYDDETASIIHSILKRIYFD